MIFDECMQELDAMMRADVQIWKDRMTSIAKGESESQEKNEMSSIENAITGDAA
jgi:hypothetical protein